MPQPLLVRVTENFQAKRSSLMAQRGRRRVNLEGKIRAEMTKHDESVEAIIAKKLGPPEKSRSRMTFEAAMLLLAIEHGGDPKVVQRNPIFQKIISFAKRKGPHGKWHRVRDFLDQFIKHHAPDWNW